MLPEIETGALPYGYDLCCTGRVMAADEESDNYDDGKGKPLTYENINENFKLNVSTTSRQCVCSFPRSCSGKIIVFLLLSHVEVLGSAKNT